MKALNTSNSISTNNDLLLLQTLVKDALAGQRLNHVNKYLGDYTRNNTNQYERFLHRLTGKTIPDHIVRKNTYNDRISAQRKQKRVSSPKVITPPYATIIVKHS